MSPQPSPGRALLFNNPGEREKCVKSHGRFARSLSTVFLADSFQVGAKPEFAVPLLWCRRVAWVCSFLGASQVARWGRICLPVQETHIRSLSWEDPLGKEMTTHCSILAWRIPCIETGEIQSMGSQRVRHNQATEHTHTLFPRVDAFIPCKLCFGKLSSESFCH